MASEIKIKVTAENATGRSLKDVKDDLEDVETASDKAGNASHNLALSQQALKQDSLKLSEAIAKSEASLDRLSEAMHAAGKASDDLDEAGESTQKLATRQDELRSSLGKLDASIATSKASLGTLAGALAETDNAAQRLDIRKAMDKVSSDLAASMKARKIKLSEMVDLDSNDSGNAGRSFISKFMSGATAAAGPVSKLLGSHVGITIGVAAAAAAAPVLASGIGSLLSGALGAGVIGAGVALAVSGDQKIMSAGKDAGKKFLKGMQDEAKVFAGPIRELLGSLQETGVRLTRKWGEAFDALRGNVAPFIEDVVSGVERLSDSITNVAKGSGAEALDGFGDMWKLLADGVGDFVEILADGGPEAADNLRLIAGGTADVLRQTATFLDVLNQAAQNEWIAGPLLPALAEKYAEAADATGTFTKHTQGSSDAMQEAADAALGEKGALEALSAELKAQADPVSGVIKAQQDLKAAQKETAEATKKHGKNSDEAKNALQKQMKAALDLESNIGKLGDTFNGKLSPAMRNTLRAAGLTDDAIDGLEKQFGQARKAGDRFARTYRAKAVLDGYRDASGKLGGLLRDLQSFDGVWTATMITNYVKHGKPGTGGGLASGGIKGAANGAMSTDLTWVGEHGPELVDLPAGTRVHSNPDSERMMAKKGGQEGQGPIIVNLVVDGRVLAQTMMDPQRDIVRTQFGGNVQLALGRS